MNTRCDFKTFNECSCGIECAAQPSARLIDLNRRHAAAVTSRDRAWIAFIGAVILIPALGFAALHAADVHHTQILTNQESGIVAWKR